MLDKDPLSSALAPWLEVGRSCCAALFCAAWRLMRKRARAVTRRIRTQAPAPMPPIAPGDNPPPNLLLLLVSLPAFITSPRSMVPPEDNVVDTFELDEMSDVDSLEARDIEMWVW